MIASNERITCALLPGGTVQCWGYNFNGQLGNGTTDASSVPVPVAGITNATMVAPGFSHTCVVLSGGSIQCWGNNAFGQLGNGTTTDSSVPVTVSGF
jgi:alpha-tubulin suppressor-like RCC1 family protein